MFTTNTSAAKWISNNNIDFGQNCVFIGFDADNFHYDDELTWDKALIAAMDTSGILKYSLVSYRFDKNKTINREDVALLAGKYIEFCEDFLLNDGKKSVGSNLNVVMNQFTFVEKHEIWERLKNTGFNIIWLPPLSTLNPLEELWHSLNHLSLRENSSDDVNEIIHDMICSVDGAFAKSTIDGAAKNVKELLN
ncbi:uncharacterized protein KGF55_005167 [Candida pseudojiufengensis]|uniref:uncharacterized protein n=1 Tax=Candida pseudojiufengensis TaxID=497109 RepID=UPI002224CA47|nr:uncharacterized protein KGF55_005167 [Candida pseudojiufengensis]KAI5959935.1 hypothetical protein KGF55_005167 [Candida pseudojiufengensis]